MDTKANGASPMKHPDSQQNIVPSHARERGHLSGLPGSPNVGDLASTVQYHTAQVLDYTSEMREAKIRELQEAVKSGTYHVTAEQIADKMLRDTLRELLP